MDLIAQIGLRAVGAPFHVRIKRPAVAVCFQMVLLSGPVQAQLVPAAEVSAGYGFMHDAELEETFPVGWLASVAWNVTDVFAIIAELSGQHTRSDYESLSTETVSGSCGGFGGCFNFFGPSVGRIVRSVRIRGEQQVDLYAPLAGLRVSRRSPRITRHVHLLVGIARVRRDVEQNELHVEADPSFPSFQTSTLPVLRDFVRTETWPVVQLGAGIGIPLGANLSFRFAADYRRNIGTRDLSQFRLSSGVAVGIGSR